MFNININIKKAYYGDMFIALYHQQRASYVLMAMGKYVWRGKFLFFVCFIVFYHHVFFLCVSLRFFIALFSCVFHRGCGVDTTVQWSVGGRMPSGPGPCNTLNNGLIYACSVNNEHAYIRL